MNENCTIGAVLGDSDLIIFKNRDLIIAPEEANLPEPTIEEGVCPYIKFGAGKKGVWAGINAYGLGVVGADGNGIINLGGKRYGKGHLTWEAYEHVIKNFKAVDEAYPWLVNYYDNNLIGGTGDIILLADTTKALILEYARPGIWGLNFCGLDIKPDFPHYIARTNFFITLDKYRPAREDSPVHMSSAARYESAIQSLALTGGETSVKDVKQMLQSHLNGNSTFSTCRHGGKGEYNTVGSVVMHSDEDKVKVHYVINSHVCRNSYKLAELKRVV